MDFPQSLREHFTPTCEKSKQATRKKKNPTLREGDFSLFVQAKEKGGVTITYEKTITKVRAFLKPAYKFPKTYPQETSSQGGTSKVQLLGRNCP